METKQESAVYRTSHDKLKEIPDEALDSEILRLFRMLTPQEQGLAIRLADQLLQEQKVGGQKAGGA